SSVNAYSRESLAHLIPLRNGYYVQVVHAFGMWKLLDWLHTLGGLKIRIVLLGNCASCIIPRVQVRQFDGKNTCLYGIQPSVVAFNDVAIFTVLTVVTKHTYASREFWVVGRH